MRDPSFLKGISTKRNVNNLNKNLFVDSISHVMLNV